MIVSSTAQSTDDAQLIRVPFTSSETGEPRNYLVYLPRGYNSDDQKKWPVLMFLHGAGERGNGTDELDFILLHGPIGEAWIYKRDLPFVMIGPQLPGFGMTDQLAYRDGVALPKRLDSGIPERRPVARGSAAVSRLLDDGDARTSLPNGWERIEDDLVMMIKSTLANYNTDPDRVYLTGLSYGGYGTFMMASRHPDLFAAVAPICGSATIESMTPIAAADLPIWIIQGGRDSVVKPGWAYPLFNELEAKGHSSVRLTMHEDLAHNSWSRAYGGADLYEWLLSHTNNDQDDNSPHREKDDS